MDKSKEYEMPIVKEPESIVQDDIITALSPKQQRFVHLYLTGQYQLPKLAQLLDVHYNTVRGWLRRDDIKKVILLYQQDEHQIIEQGLKAMRFKAIEKLSNLIDSPIDGVALQAVNTVLDRTGHKPKQEIKKEVTVKSFESQIMELANATVRDEEIIDVDFDDVN